MGHEKVSYSDKLRIQSVHWRLISPFFNRYSSRSYASLYVCRLTCRSSHSLSCCLSAFYGIICVCESLRKNTKFMLVASSAVATGFRFRPYQTYCQDQRRWCRPWSCQIQSALLSTRHTRCCCLPSFCRWGIPCSDQDCISFLLLCICHIDVHVPDGW